MNFYETNVINVAAQGMKVIEEISTRNVTENTYHMDVEEVSMAAAVRACGSKLGYALMFPVYSIESSIVVILHYEKYRFVYVRYITVGVINFYETNVINNAAQGMAVIAAIST